MQPSVVDRVAGLPLISSTYGMVSAAYTSTKENYPHVRTVCDVAEKGVKTLTTAAVSTAQPILSKLEPQIATASEYAHRGLDRLQESLPILQQPTEKVSAKSVDSILRPCLDLPSPAACTAQGTCDSSHRPHLYWARRSLRLATFSQECPLDPTEPRAKGTLGLSSGSGPSTTKQSLDCGPHP